MATSISICATCGVEHCHPLPEVCAICDDERQYLPPDGVQKWTTLPEVEDGRSVKIWEIEPNLHGLLVEPQIGIGQRSLLVQTLNGNLLWDPPVFIDNDAITAVENLGGIAWITASHPHMFGVQLEWSAAFSNATVFVSERDRQWIAREGDALQTWDDELELAPNLKLIRVGGHFAGMAVAHWNGADHAGVLLSADAIVPVADHGWATFMRSYPNQIPLSPLGVQRIADRVRDLTFDRLYGNFLERVCPSDAHAMVQRSAVRHIEWMTGKHDDLM